MNKNFIKMLCESEIQSTELALAVENMSNQLQSMIEKITNLKTKELSTLVKKIKYDNDIERAQNFEQSIGGKLDQLIQTITDIKGELDNEVVKLFNDEDSSMGMGAEGSDEGLSDLDSELGGIEEEPTGDMGAEGADDLGLPSEEELDATLDEIGREEK